MRSFTHSIFIAVLSLMLADRIPLALAAPPSDDTFAGATPVDFGFSEELDTTEATTDSDDAQLNALCGAPATDASVWYTIEGSGTGVRVDVSQSGYSAGVIVGVVNQEGNLQSVACGPNAVVFFAEAGTTYYVLAFDDQFDGGGNGGTLRIAFTEIPFPQVDITVNPKGTVDARTGIATISGTYTCADGEFIQASGSARQSVGRVATVTGFVFFSAVGTCDGEPHSWSAEVFPQSGRFAGGKALAEIGAISCDQSLNCGQASVAQTAQLRGAGKK
jgi:uncharacterized protein DUF6299